MTKIYASSDHHLFHRNIIKYANRPFDFNDENCVIDNARLMIDRHNSTVSDNDYVLMVGDLSASLRGRYDMFSNILKMLKGRKVLIRGNHDHMKDQFYLDAGFIDVVEYMEIGDNFICHYPCSAVKPNRKGPEPGYIEYLKNTNCTNVIHGHVHNNDPAEWNPDGYTRQNVCVDFAPNNYYPQELTQSEIKDYLIEKYGR